ncbi:hypothetical protein LTR17_011609 [Elasticomyces elasticus]|nr:hypothetical protein LTR17_011609 [Elasticomyces elasticus]
MTTLWLRASSRFVAPRWQQPTRLYGKWNQPKGIELFKIEQSAPQAALTSGGSQLQRDLVSNTVDPVITLRRRLANGTADLETARVCLDHYYRRLTQLPRKQRRQQIQDDDIGSLALQWLWSEDHRWVRAVTSDVISLKRICYFTVAEGCDDSLVEWLTKPLAALVDEDVQDNDTHQWRGAVLRLIMEGYLTLDCDARADEAITKFFSVADRVLAARQERKSSGLDSPLSRISLWPAQVALIKELTSARYHNTDVRLWDKFVKFAIQSGYCTDHSAAKLALTHPAKPEAGPAISYVRSHLAPLSRADFEREFPTGSSIRLSMAFFLRRISEITLRQNKTTDHDYVEQLMRTLLDDQERTSLEVKWQEQARWMKPAARRKEKRYKPVS